MSLKPGVILSLFVAFLVSDAVGQRADSVASLEGAPCWIEDADAADGHVWLLCDREIVYISDDSGATWRHSRLPSDTRLRSIHVLDGTRGFVAGDNGTLYSTKDAGRTWISVKLPSTENLREIAFVGESGWIAAHGGVILHSGDGGVTWTLQSSGTKISLEGIFFRDARHGWAVGWNGTIVRTIDGGLKWEPIRSPAAMRSLSAVYFRDLQNGWAVGMSGQLIRSRDGGVSWEAQTAPVSSWLTSILFDASGRGWITAENDLLISNDGGENWRALGLSNVWLFLETVVPVKQALWAIGPFGILKRERVDNEWKRLGTLPKNG
jgi:photosystem II stability/assembly factor-like uncharacterized protein